MALAWLCLLAGPGSAQPAAPDVVTLTEGLIRFDDAARPPPLEAGSWEPVRLPDLWQDSRPGVRRQAWYRFEIPARPESDGLLGVYFPLIDMNVAVWLDDVRLGACGSFEEPIARCWSRPFYVPLGRSDGRPGVLSVRLDPGLDHGGMAPIQVGPHEVLLEKYLWNRFLRVGVVRHFSGMAVLVATLMIVFWIGSRDPAYGYFALLILLWGLSALDSHVRDVPVSHALWEWFVHACIDWMAVAGVLVAHRLTRVQRPRLERAMVIAMAVATGATAFAPSQRLHEAVVVVHVGAIGLGVYAGWVLMRGTRLHAWGRHLAVFAVGGAVAIGVHDLLVLGGTLPIDQTRMMVLVAPLLTFSFTVLLGVRFVTQLERTRRLTVGLEERVREKHAELEANFERVRELERERAIITERQRIMREVHDGMGAQLVSALAMVEGGQTSNAEISEVLRSSIDDMRLVVDSLDPDVDDLPMLLGMVRGRIEPRLRRHGLRFDWRITDLPPVERFGPPEFLNVLRIVQEAITNVLRHARASVVTVTTGVWPSQGASQGVFVSLRDDGVGLDSDVVAGRGLRNMVRRAWDVRGELRIEHAEPGTRITLYVPFDPTAGVPPEGGPEEGEGAAAAADGDDAGHAEKRGRSIG